MKKSLVYLIMLEEIMNLKDEDINELFYELTGDTLSWLKCETRSECDYSRWVTDVTKTRRQLRRMNNLLSEKDRPDA